MSENAPRLFTIPRVGLLLIATALASATFVADLFTPLGIAGGAPYTVLVLLGLWSRRRMYIPIAAGVATALTIFGAILSPPGTGAWTILVNRVLTLLAIWTIALLLLHYDRTRRALVRSRQDARAYLEIADIIFLVLDPEGRIVLLNRKGGRVLEVDPEEAIGKDWFETFLPERVRADVSAVFHQLIAGEAPPVEYHENPVRTASGEERLIAWHNAIVRDEEGRITGALSSGEDVTDRRAAQERERQRDALARLGQMAAVVAHEVKNPIAGIAGAIQILARRLPREAESREIFDSILERLDGLDRMSRDLLGFARPREPERRTVDLSGLLERTAGLLASDPEHVGTSVQIEATPANVSADPDLLENVFLNLLLNASQAMNGRGHIQVEIRPDDGSVQILVTDSGPGIPAEKRAHVFEPFFTTKHRGTGLGLAVARQTIEAHGGTIDIDCPSGGGTTVRVRLPQPATGGAAPAGTAQPVRRDLA